MENKKRILICGMHQESNSFNPVLSREEIFWIGEGESLAAFRGVNKSITGGMIDTLEDAGVDVVYGRMMSAASGAPQETAVYERLLAKTLADIRAAGHLDGVAVSLHGATLSESSDDVCGDYLAAIRAAVGEEIPIAAGFDLHANITEKIAKNTDYICGYLEYPHIDQHETGCRAAKLLLRHLAGKRGYVAYAKIPMIAPAHAYTTREGGLKVLTDTAKRMVATGKILDYTVFEAQPWLDAVEMATTVLVTAEDEETAKNAANALLLHHFALRRELQGTPLVSVEEVAERALQNKSGKPVVLVDSADSRGAGSTADSAAVIERLLPYADRLRIAVGVSDAPAVEEAFRVGVGNRADFTLGATVAPALSRPVRVVNALVRSLHCGDFYAVGPIGRGTRHNGGKTAVLQVGKMLIKVAFPGTNEKDIGYYSSFGIDPEFCDLVCVKACTSFRAGYAPIAAEICNTATPGAAGTVLTDLPYRKRPVPLYPFEEISEADLTRAVCYRT